MLAKVQELFAKAEAMPLSFRDWLLAVFMVIFVRLFLENTSSGGYFRHVGYEFQSLVHVSLYFVAAISAITLVLAFFAKKEVMSAARVKLLFFPIIWIAPIVDHLSHWAFGTSMQMSYLLQDGAGLVRNFFTFFGSHQMPGVTVGIRFAIFSLLVFTFLYVFVSTKRLSRSIIAVFFMYMTAILFSSWPSFVAMVAGGPIPEVSFIRSIESPLLERNSAQLTARSDPLPNGQFFVYPDVAYSHATYLAIVLFAIVAAISINPRKFIASLKHSRALFVGKLYIISLALGMALAIRDGNTLTVTSWVDATYFAILLLTFTFSWLYAAGINDIEDLLGDRVTNRKRPLVTGEITVEDARAYNLAFLFFSLVGAYLLGQFVFLLILAGIALAHLYSCPPFRLKRFAGVNPFIVSLSVLLPVLAGYYVISEDRSISAFPGEYLPLLLLAHMAWVNIKDLKDLEGDRAMGSHTLPTIFGLTRSKKIIGALSLAGFLLFPLFMHGNLFFWTISILAGGLSYRLTTRPSFSLRGAFILIAAYLIVVIVSILRS